MNAMVHKPWYESYNEFFYSRDISTKTVVET